MDANGEIQKIGAGKLVYAKSTKMSLSQSFYETRGTRHKSYYMAGTLPAGCGRSHMSCEQFGMSHDRPALQTKLFCRRADWLESDCMQSGLAAEFDKE